MRIRFTVLIILFLIFSEKILLAQILPFHNYTVKDGLVSDNITSICQDSLGYIWFGTGEGISIFNSKEFKNISTIDGLSSDKISFITADKKIPGDVWIGTVSAGINRFHNGQFIKYGLNLPLLMRDINNIYEDDDNTFWCGTDSGFYFIKHDKINLISTNYKLGWVNSFVHKSTNEVLVAAENGLFKYLVSQKKLEKINLPELLKHDFNSLLKSKDGSIYVAMVGGILFRIRGSEISKINLNASPRTMIEDNYNNIWIGAVEGLLKIREDSFSSNKIIRYNIDNGLLENNITSLLYDRENILWIGSNDNGLSKLSYQNLIQFKLPQKYIGANWASVSSDNNSHFWIALTKYLLEIWKDENHNWHEKLHSLEPFYPNEPLPSLYLSKNNNLYIAKPSGEINIYKISRKNSAANSPSILTFKDKIKIPKKIKYSSLFKILVDNNGYIWCSILDAGVAVINNSKPRNILKIYNQTDGLPDNSVREIFQDSKENIWFGGYGSGLSVFSKGKIDFDISKASGVLINNKFGEKNFVKLFTTSEGLPDNGIRSIEESKNGNIIVGTRYGGLAIYKPDAKKSSKNQFIIINRENGLLSNAIWSITKTLGGNIWLGTQSGVQELTGEGLPSYKLYEELPKVPYYSICSSAAGNLCFANQSEVFIYEPLKENEKTLPPPIYINQILINGQKQKLKNNFDLASYQNTITINFVGIVNREEKNTIYKYKLLKIDKNWNELQNQNSITYASLRPGFYTFQVYAINGKNIKSKFPAQISFLIETPFFMQWWFIVLILVIIITSIGAYSRMRFRRLIEIEKIRTRIAADLHDEIGSGLTRIAILSENVLREESSTQNKESDFEKNKNEKYSRQSSIERVGKISRDLVDSMIDVIWSIDPKFDSLHDFIFNFKNFANEVCEAKNIQLIIETNNIENIKLNSQIKRSLQLITKEALNNALKYSKCKTFKVNLSVKSKIIYLTLEDDGTGFEINEAKNGRGIFNISKHVKELKGNFKLDSSVRNGTQLYINFPIQS